MTDKPAFPHQKADGTPYNGMTLRDYFAAKAAPTLLTELYAQSIRHDVKFDNIYEIAAAASYEMADAMLAARSKT